MNGLGYPRRGLHGRVVNELGLRLVAGAWPSGAPLPNEDDLAAELDFHGAVVEAAQNSLLSHVSAMIRVALEAAAEPHGSDADGREASLRTAVATAIRARDADASEAAMRSLVDLAWRQVVADDSGANL